ncbi:helix-turn-helix domain-containing protein [Streptomyces sp. H27-D2]|uniref:helix-turn-helix domain-containing protein n=1 Tax=Streptomyces sp. H27-D2 TaxID=3046304 RepID=UPI002DB6EA4F|nr:helix-turn-helix transcriptional regulator [Streptomyces sp. H27-D2]MEC4018436.1 helix-turn-helix transcriptional regulator [Streptomyces sp. H27-D2]
MPAGGKATVRSRRLGTALKRYRLAAQLDQEHAAEALGCSKAKISRVESGISGSRVGDVRVLLDLYEVEDANMRVQLEHLARESNKRGWWLDYQGTVSDEHADLIALETDATYIRSWQPLFIPGLLQTQDYFKALLDTGLTVYSPEVIEKTVAIRQERKRIIEEPGSHFAAVIWEPALTAPMPSPKTHREQLMYLVHVAQRQNISIQVLPFSDWAAAHMASHFVMFSFGPEPAPEAVALDSTTTTAILEDLEDVAKHARIFEALRSAALSPEQSLTFLQKAIEDIPDSEKESE